MTALDVLKCVGSLFLWFIAIFAAICLIVFIADIVIYTGRMIFGGKKMEKTYSLKDIEAAHESASLILDQKMKEKLGEDESQWPKEDSIGYDTGCHAILAHWSLMRNLLVGDEEDKNV